MLPAPAALVSVHATASVASVAHMTTSPTEPKATLTLPERLKALVEMGKEATPGPWEWHTGCSWWRLSSKNGRRSGDVICPVVNQYDNHPDLSIPNKADADLIVEMRNSLPDLAQAAEQLTAKDKEIERLRAALTRHVIIESCDDPDEAPNGFECLELAKCEPENPQAPPSQTPSE
jgi:hypothetical protein